VDVWGWGGLRTAGTGDSSAPCQALGRDWYGLALALLLDVNRRLHAALLERGTALGRDPGFTGVRGVRRRSRPGTGLPDGLEFVSADGKR
jgi:hypothetical protein